jgi:drug/metabolite transporter (DMT)-like permease
MSHQRRAVLLLVATALLWSTAGLLIKQIDWNAPAIAGGRSALAALVLLAVVRRRRFTWSAAQIGGAVAYSTTVTLFVFANKLTTAANAILLQYTAPIWIAVFSPWFLKERAHWFDWVIMLLILAGIALFFADKLSVAGMWGNILALVTGLAFAWLALCLRKQKDGSAFESVFLGNVLTVLVCSPFMFRSLPHAGGSTWLGCLLLLALGILQLGLSYILYSIAIRHVSALEAMLIPAIEPILNPVLVLLVVHERPGAWAIAGGTIVLGAVAARGLLTVSRTLGPARTAPRQS